MNREQWNKLYGRAWRAINAKGRHDLWQQNTLKLRWLNWAERKTGKRCFFMPWQ